MRRLPTKSHLKFQHIQLPQRLRRVSLFPHLEELNADLPRWRIPAVELLGRGNDGALDVVGCDAVSDDDEVKGLDVVGASALEGGKLGFQDGVEAGAGLGAAAGADGVEDGVDVGGAGDVFVLAAVFLIIDAVGVVSGADEFERLRGFFPGAAGHGGRVVD